MKWPWHRFQERVEQKAALTAVRALEPIFGSFIQEKTSKKPVAFDWPWAYQYHLSTKRKPQSLIDIESIRLFSEVCDVARSCIEHIKREVSAVPIQVVPKDPEDVEAKSLTKDIDIFFETSGGCGGFGRRRSAFEAQWIEDVLTVGATAIWLERTRKGDLYQAIAIDASTIRPMTDALGWIDPQKAYTQHIQGVEVEVFRFDELIYDGLNPVPYSPYFKSPFEWLVSPVMSFIKADEWNRSWLMGNAPGDNVYSLPESLTADEVSAYKAVYDAVFSNNARERQNVVFFPFGTERLSNGTRKDQDFAEFEKSLTRRICSVFGVHPASIGYADQQYKVSQENSMESTTRFGVGEVLEFRKALYDNLLCHLGYGERFEILNASLVDEDVTVKRSQRIKNLVGRPIMTVNEARKIEGLDPIEGGDMLIEDYKGPEEEEKEDEASEESAEDGAENADVS